MKISNARILEISRYMSFVLRHKPSAVGISLNSEGWVELSALVSGLRSKFPEIDTPMVRHIVETDEKGRYSISNSMIRANQGHSINVCAIDLTPQSPPQHLYHGTTHTAWEKIRASKAISKMKRHHVHLSPDLETARAVAARRNDKTVILRIEAQKMSANGFVFFCSENGVWHVDEVPLNFVSELA